LQNVDSLELILAIGLAVASVITVVVSYTVHILISNRRIRRAELLSTSVVTFSPALIITLDNRNRIVAFNKRLEVLSGYTAEQVIGKKGADLEFLSFLPTNSARDASSSYEFRHSGILMAADGFEHCIEWQVGTVTDYEKDSAVTIVSGIDVTELHLAQEKLKTLTAKLSSTEERERKRIAEELHDRIGETLVLTARRVDDLKQKLSSEEMQKALDELGENIQHFLKDARSLIFELIPPILYDIGLEAALRSFASYCKKQYQITVTVSDDGKEKSLDHDKSAFLYKAVRELVLNVIRHADAHAAHVNLTVMQGAVNVVVEDNGSGFPSSVLRSNGTALSGFGLLNIKTQAEHYGGSLEIQTNGKAGGRVSILVPLNRDVYAD